MQPTGFTMKIQTLVAALALTLGGAAFAQAPAAPAAKDTAPAATSMPAPAPTAKKAAAHPKKHAKAAHKTMKKQTASAAGTKAHRHA